MYNFSKFVHRTLKNCMLYKFPKKLEILIWYIVDFIEKNDKYKIYAICWIDVRFLIFVKFIDTWRGKFNE